MKIASPEQLPPSGSGEVGGAAAVLGERFELRRRIGEGGFGEVYEAFDRKRGAVVALKLPHDNLVARQQFKQEFRALADLVHPNLVTLYELETTGDRWFFTMELVRGRPFLDEVWRYTVPPHSMTMGSDPSRGASGVRGEAAASAASAAVPHGVAGEVTAPVEPVLALALEAPPERMSPSVQLDRLYPVLLQLGDGLEALHTAGTLHRDVKPSNVLVTEEGRVVILDFGLARELAPSEAPRGRETQVVGTPGYMSPEQMMGKPLTAASDWYSVGVMLYEVLTGRLPFIGLSVELLLAQQQLEPPAPSRLAPGTPPELESLCLDLLRPDPERRPSGAEVRARLLGLDQHLGSGVAQAVSAARWRRSEERLVGRERHLQLLWQAYGEAVAGETVVALCRGSSGMGKSALVRQFRHQLGQRESAALVLHGRCYEHEEMPFKAVDGIADGLADWLRGLGQDEAEALVQQDGWALGRLFPALFQVEAVARAPWRQVADATLLRQAGFFALRKLLGRIAKDHPVVLVIDDLQWGDLDSVALLTELLRMPGAPALFLVVVYRAEEEETSPVVRGLRGMLPGPASAGLRVHELEVAGLDPPEALALALEFGGETARAQAIAAETGGNPFFITELARHASGAADAAVAAQMAAGSSTVDACIRLRIGQLPLVTQRLLEVVVVSGQPLRREVARQVAEAGWAEEVQAGRPAETTRIESPALEEPRILAELRGERLIRIQRNHEREEFVPYHDRVRQAMLGGLPEGRRRAIHHRLALALAAGGDAEPERLALHFQQAGLPVEATRHALVAARQAEKALAFHQAARLYQMVLDMRCLERQDMVEARVHLAASLAAARRPVEAAQIYLQVAAEEPSAAALEHRRQAAELLLFSGNQREAMAVLGKVLHAVGLRLGEGGTRDLAELLWLRLRLRLRGLGFRERPEAEIDAATLLRIDTCWSAAIGLVLFDPVGAARLQAWHLLFALEAGEVYRVARALATEGVFQAFGGWRSLARAQQLVDQALELAQRSGRPEAVALAIMDQGFVASSSGDWRRGATLLSSAATLLREHATGLFYDLNTIYSVLGFCLWQQGEIQQLARSLLEFLPEAQERADRYSESMLLAMGFYGELAADAPEAAAETMRRAVALWPLEQPFLLGYLSVMNQVRLHLYQDQGAAAWQLVEAEWPQLERRGLVRMYSARVECLYWYALAALAADGSAGERKTLRRVAHQARKLERERTPWTEGLAHLVRAAIASRRGADAEALDLWQMAEKELLAADVPLMAMAARRQRGVWIGGDEGQALVAEADAWMEGQEIRAPARMAAVLAPRGGRSGGLAVDSSTEQVSVSDPP